jgi:hypothetical protein
MVIAEYSYSWSNAEKQGQLTAQTIRKYIDYQCFKRFPDLEFVPL